MTAAATENAPLALIQGEPIDLSSTRVLLGWLSEQEAIRPLLGRNPAPQDDLTAIREQATRARAGVCRVRTPRPVTPSFRVTGRCLIKSLHAPNYERASLRALDD